MSNSKKHASSSFSIPWQYLTLFIAPVSLWSRDYSLLSPLIALQNSNNSLQQLYFIRQNPSPSTSHPSPADPIDNSQHNLFSLPKHIASSFSSKNRESPEKRREKAWIPAIPTDSPRWLVSFLPTPWISWNNGFLKCWSHFLHSSLFWSFFCKNYKGLLIHSFYCIGTRKAFKAWRYLSLPPSFYNDVIKNRAPLRTFSIVNDIFYSTIFAILPYLLRRPFLMIMKPDCMCRHLLSPPFLTVVLIPFSL